MEIKDIIIFIVACLVSYLIGGISIARFITSNENKGDISKQGSGNPGTMNMLRTHGIVMGLFTLLCDALKGVAPALFGLLYFKEVVGIEMGYIALYTFGLFAVFDYYKLNCSEQYVTGPWIDMYVLFSWVNTY